jgi:hypothetical protein
MDVSSFLQVVRYLSLKARLLDDKGGAPGGCVRFITVWVVGTCELYFSQVGRGLRARLFRMWVACRIYLWNMT